MPVATRWAPQAIPPFSLAKESKTTFLLEGVVHTVKFSWKSYVTEAITIECDRKSPWQEAHML